MSVASGNSNTLTACSQVESSRAEAINWVGVTFRVHCNQNRWMQSIEGWLEGILETHLASIALEINIRHCLCQHYGTVLNTDFARWNIPVLMYWWCQWFVSGSWQCMIEAKCFQAACTTVHRAYCFLFTLLITLNLHISHALHRSLSDGKTSLSPFTEVMLAPSGFPETCTSAEFWQKRELRKAVMAYSILEQPSNSRNTAN